MDSRTYNRGIFLLFFLKVGVDMMESEFHFSHNILIYLRHISVLQFYWTSGPSGAMPPRDFA